MVLHDFRSSGAKDLDTNGVKAYNPVDASGWGCNMVRRTITFAPRLEEMLQKGRGHAIAKTGKDVSLTDFVNLLLAIGMIAAAKGKIDHSDLDLASYLLKGIDFKFSGAFGEAMAAVLRENPCQKFLFDLQTP